LKSEPFTQKFGHARQTYSEAGLAQSRLWPAGTLAITIAANIAETAILTFPACFPDSVVGFTADPAKADVRFIEYLFQAMRKQVKSHAYGSAQENINLEVLRKLEFPIPPLQLQTKIADYLSLIDDRITLLRETNTTLEAIAQALFKSWFVDFDPVRAKMEGRTPEGMDEATAALFPDGFETSELGEVPRGWEVRTLGSLLTPKRGKSITKSKCIEGEIPVVAGGLEPAYFHNTSNVSSPVVTISASGANAGFVRLYQQDIWASDCSFVSEKETDIVYFWYIFLKINQEKIYFMQQGAAQPHIYLSGPG
jgi:type I restriction enzyme S subunit